MKIAVVIAKFHPGTTGDYVNNALITLGHHSQILTGADFLAAFSQDNFDRYVCVDSGDPINFAALRSDGPFHKLSMWFIDFRHNKDGDGRSPTDFENARFLDSKGSWIFQSQFEDYEETVKAGIRNCSWLPLGADPMVWRNQPIEEKRFDIGFVGNIWDSTRKDAIESLQKAGFRVGFQGAGSLWGVQAAKLLRMSRVGFNISSFFGTSIAFDLNMRFFETLACGIPIITNYVPSLIKIGAVSQRWLCTYENFEDIVPAANLALSDEEFLSSGVYARSWVLSEHTYQHRVIEILGRALASEETKLAK